MTRQYEQFKSGTDSLPEGLRYWNEVFGDAIRLETFASVNPDWDRAVILRYGQDFFAHDRFQGKRLRQELTTGGYVEARDSGYEAYVHWVIPRQTGTVFHSDDVLVAEGADLDEVTERMRQRIVHIEAQERALESAVHERMYEDVDETRRSKIRQWSWWPRVARHCNPDGTASIVFDGSGMDREPLARGYRRAEIRLSESGEVTAIRYDYEHYRIPEHDQWAPPGMRDRYLIPAVTADAKCASISEAFDWVFATDPRLG